MNASLEERVPFRSGIPGWPALFAAIDRRDAVAFAGLLAPEAEFRFGNAPPVRGRADIARVVAGFFAMIASCRHRVSRTWDDATSAVCEGEVTYGVAGGASVSLSFVNVLELSASGISSYRIYIDNGPLFAALGAAGTVGSTGSAP